MILMRKLAEDKKMAGEGVRRRAGGGGLEATMRVNEKYGQRRETP
jgi:hypothetical protein